MQGRMRTAAVMALVFLYPFAATAEPSAPAPVSKVGEKWVYARPDGTEYTITVKETRPDGSRLVVAENIWGPCPGCLEEEDRNLTVTAVLDSSGGRRDDFSYLLGWKYLDFPLAVEKRWESKTTWRANPGFYENRMEVIGVEEITVPAGKFSAFKIRWRQTNSVKNFAKEGVYWYIPECRAIGRWEAPWLPNAGSLKTCPR